MELKWEPGALIDLEEAIEWYEFRRQGLGAEFKKSCDDAVSEIHVHPLLWPRIRFQVRRCLIERFPYGIFYLVEGEQITIVAVAHGKRRPGYWRSRVRH